MLFKSNPKGHFWGPKQLFGEPIVKASSRSQVCPRLQSDIDGYPPQLQPQFVRCSAQRNLLRRKLGFVEACWQIWGTHTPVEDLTPRKASILQHPQSNQFPLKCPTHLVATVTRELTSVIQFLLSVRVYVGVYVLFLP